MGVVSSSNRRCGQGYASPLATCMVFRLVKFVLAPLELMEEGCFLEEATAGLLF